MSAGLAVAAAGLLLFLPGAIAASALGMRGASALGAAPALSLGLYACVAVVFGAAGVRWEPTTVGLALLVVLIGLTAARRPWRRGVTDAPDRTGTRAARWRPWSGHAAVLALWAVVSAVSAYLVVRASQGLQRPQQYWDAMFHANAVRWIAEHGDIAPADLAPLAQPENDAFYYPDVFHGVAALLVDLGAGSVPVAINAVLAVLPGVFAAGAGLLAWVLFGRPVVSAAALVLATVVTAFPYDLFFWGPLWPFGTAVAAIGSAAALILLLARHGSSATAVAAALGLLGVVHTQPAAGVGCLLLAVVLGLPQMLVCLRRLPGPRERLQHAGWVLFAAAVFTLVSAPLVSSLTGQSGGLGGVDWPAVASPGQAIGQLLTFNQDSAHPQWALAALLLVGVLAAPRCGWRGWSLLVATGLFAALYVMAAAYDEPLQQSLTSLWWNDRWRFAALFAVPAVIVAAVGVQVAADGLRDLIAQLPGAAGRRGRRLVPVLVLVVVAGVVVLAYFPRNQERVALGYTDGPTFSEEEQRGYAVLADLHDGGAVLNDPFDGSAWSFAYYQLPLVFRSPITPPYRPEDIGEDRLLLFREFNQLDTDEAVQTAVEDLDVRWVVISEGFTAVGQTRAAGLTDLDQVDGLELVYSDRQTSIYRLTRPGRV
ncbi:MULTISPECIES: DUF6541 family protein [unclassified Geodermatophilus]